MPDYNPWYKNSYALLIGIDTYVDPQFYSLGLAQQDALDMAAVLAADPYGFQVQTLLGKEATRQGVLDALYQYYRTDPDDRVLVYFAGHGYTLTNNFGHETGYFACYDTSAERHFTALRMDEVTGLREQAKAKHIAFVFDACFSGQALGLTKGSSTTPDQFLLRRAYQVISAGASDQTVEDYHSMTRYLLPALRSPGEMLTLETLGVYLKQTMTNVSRGMQIPQHGQITGSQGGDFVFSYHATSGQVSYPVSHSTPAPPRVRPQRRKQAESLPWKWIGAGAAALAAITMLCIGAVLLSSVLLPRETPTSAPAITEPASSDGEPTESAEPPAIVESPTTDTPASTTTPTETATLTATPTPTASLTPTPTFTPSETLTASEQAKKIAVDGVTRNADWTPYSEMKNGIKMELVPAGCFPMGSETGEGDEKPVHNVCLTAPFWIDAYEVTNGQYGRKPLDVCERFSSGDNQPRVCQSWTEAQAYCQSRGARLPTEAEWEYAARGPDGLIYPWGNNFVAGNSVYGENANGHTANVGSKPSGVSWVGAFDMSGNVWEWVHDWYGTYPSGDQVNPQGPPSGDERVMRGSSWGFNVSDLLRSTFRNEAKPDGSSFDLGFRCALSW